MSLDHQDLHTQTKEMILDVYNYFEKEAKEGPPNLNQVQRRTIDATNSSFATLRRILTAAKSKEKPDFRPCFKRKTRRRVTAFHNLDKCLLRRRIHKFYVDNEHPSIGKLLPIMRSDLNYKGSYTSIRRIIKDLGFKWNHTRNKTARLNEDHQIRFDRINFLEKMKKYRDENRTLIYSDELCLRLTNKSSNQEEYVIVVYAGSEVSFLKDALLIFSSPINAQNSQNWMDYYKYRHWLQSQLIPNLPPRSVVVLDNAPYHNKQIYPAPNVNSKKSDMQAWLADKGIPFAPELLKPELYGLIELNKASYVKYNVDETLSAHGHEVLRLPTHLQDLNPMELVGVAVKSYISSQKTIGNTEQVIELVKKKLELMGDGGWKLLCDKVKVNEEFYRNSDVVIDDLSEELDSNGPDSSDEVILYDQLRTNEDSDN